MGRGFRENPSPTSWLGLWHVEAQAERKEPVQVSHRSDKNLSSVTARALSVVSFHLASSHSAAEEATHRHHARCESQTKGWHRKPSVMEASWGGGDIEELPLHEEA